MLIKETPYISLNLIKDGFNNEYRVDYTSAALLDINTNLNLAYSYNTIIGAFIDIDGNRFYIETAAVYSTTTATKHKPRFNRLANYNNFIVIPNVKPETFILIRDTNNKNELSILLLDILEEFTDSQTIKNKINGISTNAYKENQLITEYSKHYKTEKTQYKNGNHKTVITRKTTFKYLYNYYIKTVNHYFKKTIKPYYGRNGKTTKKIYYECKTKQYIREV